MVEERYYLAYVLGYDLLHDTIDVSNNSECDTSFEICLKIVDEFMGSEDYKDMRFSTYDNFRGWIVENYWRIVDLFGK